MFDPDAPVGQRILKTQIGKAPLERARTYTIATITFLTTSGNIDGYTLPTPPLRTGDDLSDTVLRNLVKGPIGPSVDGRIVGLRQPR